MDVSARYSEAEGELPALTPTAWTVLGFLSFCPRTGYDLRQAVQRSVGHFWGVSFGQLYPQLKVLHEGGYIEAANPADADQRRTVWQLTALGGAVLDRWLRTPATPAQRRDEGMVKLLFADHSGPATMLALIDARRAEARRRRETAESVLPGAHWPADAPRAADSVLAAWLVRSHSLALANAELAWCDQAEAMLADRGAHPRYPTTSTTSTTRG